MKTLLTIFIALAAYAGYAQEQHRKDTTSRLQEVIIRPYFSEEPLLRSTGSVGLLDPPALDKQPASSLVSAMNTLPGLRMEERSPGSYRLSIRGSLLRSPFGVRNVKIYFDDFPLTDAGGGTYLNALGPSAIERVQVLKGPQGNIYGANSGGVVLLQPASAIGDSAQARIRLEGGSYGLFLQNAAFHKQTDKYALSINQAYQRSNGYRDHSAMDRKYFQIFQNLSYSNNASLKALIFYSDLHYNTPGGLTAAQFAANPRSARPASPATKSASEQQAGIYSNTLYGGLSHNWNISRNFKHVISVFSSYTDFKNPFITNYEKREEFTAGLRSYLEYVQSTDFADWKLDLGGESMSTGTDFDNYDNNLGIPGAIQASDKLKAASQFAFAHLSVDLMKKLLIEASASANFYGYHYESFAPQILARQKKRFDTQIMPRLALSYLFSDGLSMRTSVSKGYSPPTLEEVRASDQQINVDLEPEKGWNYEAGLSAQGFGNRFFLDLAVFNYRLKEAIVKRADASDEEYFVNAGGTDQWGLETQLSFWLLPQKSIGTVRGIKLSNALTISHFKFDQYQSGGNDFSGNALTGVPKTIVVSSAELLLPQSLYLFLQHNYTSSIPLNDANSFYARKYHLIQAKASWKALKAGRFPLELFAGADNLLDQTYSLGNDLNAFGGRYFNAAAGRNFYAGLVLRIR